jgi:HlyD family secretion protein/epimerase transport system membrane fusion protein
MSNSKSIVIQKRQPAYVHEPSDAVTLRNDIRGPQRAGFLLIVIFMGGFTLWGLTAKLAGGAIAPGIISPDGSRRTVQHLEGGIIASLKVRDGDKVTANQPLVMLERVQVETVLNSQLNQYYTLLALQARLRAEQNNAREITFPDELRETQLGPELAMIIEGQRTIFATRRAAHEMRREVLAQRIEQSLQQINALEAQAKSAVAQLGFIAQELDDKRHLFSKALIRKPDLLALERAQASIEGERGEYRGMVARAEQQIGETRSQLLQLDAERADQISDQLDKARVELAAVTERVQVSRDVLARTSVTAPISGTVVNLRFKTVGGVIRAGEPIVDIVPDEERLLIEARVSPTDIDVVHPGLAAQVHLTAFSKRAMPRIDGVVRSVSADRLVDPESSTAYYMARVEVDRSEMEQLGSLVVLVPGMPAEVLIVTQERTMIDYLIEPFRDAWRRSFREV